MAKKKGGATMNVKQAAAAAGAGRSKKGRGRTGKGDYRHNVGGGFAAGGEG